MVVGAAVGQLQLHGGEGAEGCIDAARGLRHLEHIFLCHREIGLDGADVRHRCQGLCARCADQCAHLERQAADDAAGRTLHVAEAERLLCRSQGCFGLSHLGAGHLVVVLRRLKFELSDDVIVEQLLVVFKSQLGRIHLCRSRIHCGLSLTHLCLIGGIVDDEQQLACANSLTFFHTNLRDEARDLRTNLYVLDTFERGRIGALHDRALCLDRHNGIFVITKIRPSALLSATRGEQRG